MKPRSRVWLACGMVLVVGAGLASRSLPWLLPPSLGTYPGDALWALLVFLGIAFIRPCIGSGQLALAALGISYLVEAAQLYQAQWINAIRATTPGHLVLGQGFDWLDLLAYTIGVAAGFALDRRRSGYQLADA
jgi:hypothetical protein